MSSSSDRDDAFDAFKYYLPRMFGKAPLKAEKGLEIKQEALSNVSSRISEYERRYREGITADDLSQAQQAGIAQLRSKLDRAEARYTELQRATTLAVERAAIDERRKFIPLAQYISSLNVALPPEIADLVADLTESLIEGVVQDKKDD